MNKLNKIQNKKQYTLLVQLQPGTDTKQLASQIVGNDPGQTVHHVDLSRIFTGHLKETEQRLNELFDQAKKENWILFFDEADALFGKRTDVSDAHDRYSNVEVSYLLGLLSKHEGRVIIGTSGDKSADASLLLLPHVIHYPKP